MIYRALKWISGIALHWFYGDIRVEYSERIPVTGPLFIAVNHQNALVDSLITAWVTPRRVTMTAKATLMDNPLIALLFRILGVVPLRRTSDEVAKGARRIDRARNNDAFREILDTLERNGVVLIFPEGKSHNKPSLEPLKSGLARLALGARDDRLIKGVKIVPIGLMFGDKSTPGSALGVRVGHAIDMDSWSEDDPDALTQEIFRRLQGVSDQLHLTTNAPEREAVRGLKGWLISLVAWWGRITHEAPVRLARTLALRKSKDADQPAMLTIVYGTGMVLGAYAISFAIVQALVHSFLVSSLYVASLVIGAYWAAFEQHTRSR
jgi:1-acyl-sn-glycerol-3-phosphate acyltransferase